jgi:hypothetical protein
VRAPLTAHSNRNFRLQEIDGELRRLLRFEPAAGGDCGERAMRVSMPRYGASYLNPNSN